MISKIFGYLQPLDKFNYMVMLVKMIWFNFRQFKFTKLEYDQ